MTPDEQDAMNIRFRDRCIVLGMIALVALGIVLDHVLSH
jgi:hypothetical protein